jgi:hypothetical protein
MTTRVDFKLSATASPFALMTVVGLIGGIIGLAVATKSYLYSYLAAFGTATVIVLGMLFFVLLHHVVDAGWSTVARRWAENFLAAIPWLVLLFLPIYLFKGTIFSWVEADDHLKHVKEPFLNPRSFGTRALVYFVTWLMLARFLRGRSLAQDSTGDPANSLSLRRWSAIGLILYALTVTFAGIDWFMSVDYHWFSTMFGTYIFAHGALAAFALLAMTAVRMRAGPLKEQIHDGTLHDLGKLTFAFSVFWAYIAFSQWFLIWYGNIPEETIWMITRAQGVWASTRWLMVALLFVIPFVFLMPASAKRNPRMLVLVGLGILVGTFTGMHWIVMPAHHPVSFGVGQVLLDIAALLLVFGVCGIAISRAFAAVPLYPLRDPRLSEATEAHA